MNEYLLDKNENFGKKGETIIQKVFPNANWTPIPFQEHKGDLGSLCLNDILVTAESKLDVRMSGWDEHGAAPTGNAFIEVETITPGGSIPGGIERAKIEKVDIYFHIDPARNMIYIFNVEDDFSWILPFPKRQTRSFLNPPGVYSVGHCVPRSVVEENASHIVQYDDNFNKTVIK
jgi:hypothetical protein